MYFPALQQQLIELRYNTETTGPLRVPGM